MTEHRERRIARRSPCSSCKGRGKVYTTYGDVQCTRCGGTGVTEQPASCEGYVDYNNGDVEFHPAHDGPCDSASEQPIRDGGES